MTLMRPFRLIILHLSHMRFTDDLTFTGDPPSVTDSMLCARHKRTHNIIPEYFTLFKHYFCVLCIIASFVASFPPFLP